MPIRGYCPVRGCDLLLSFGISVYAHQRQYTSASQCPAYGQPSCKGCSKPHKQWNQSQSYICVNESKAGNSILHVVYKMPNACRLLQLQHGLKICNLCKWNVYRCYKQAALPSFNSRVLMIFQTCNISAWYLRSQSMI